MRESRIDQHLVVYDEVLPEAAFLDLWQLMNILPYQSTAAIEWAKVWNISDGNIFRSKQIATNEMGMPRTETAIDTLIDAVIQVARNHPALAGFNGIAVIPYVWPQQSSISWHSDGAAYETHSRIGGFTFYAHKYWNAEWGGEFLMFPERGQQGLVFDNSNVSEQILSRGIGTWISPKPNRLLFITGDALHKVSKTSPVAAPRLTIQGFIYRR